MGAVSGYGLLSGLLHFLRILGLNLFLQQYSLPQFCFLIFNQERLRIILHAHNTEEEIHALMDAIEAALPTNASSDALKEAAAPISRL